MIERLRRRFAPVPRGWDGLRAILYNLAELGGFMAVAIAFSHWLSPDDPFGITAQFPWLWLIPAVIALRYGTLNGLLSALMVFGWWFYLARSAPATMPFPQQYFLGGLVLVLIAGQFADVWTDRLTKVREVNAYLNERLTSLTRSHFLLRLSHERLEQEILVRPVTLRDQLTDLRRADPIADEKLPGAAKLLRLLGQSCELESAAVYRSEGQGFDAQPAASIGDPVPLVGTDPLVELATQQGELAHVRSQDAARRLSEYLVCAPIISSNRMRLGVVTVRSMPFFALNQENLQTIAVLVNYFADGLVHERAIRPVTLLRPGCPTDFALELIRLQRLRRLAKVESTMVGFTFEATEEGNTLFDQVRRIKRSLDLSWEIAQPQRHVLLVLLALSGQAAVEGFLQRIEGAIKKQFEVDFVTGRVAVHVTPLSDAEPEWILDDLLNRCKVVEQPLQVAL